MIPATANVTSGQIPTRGETSRETPFASTSDSPTLSRVTNVDAMPARLRSMNSTRLKWVPTATISSAPRSWASRRAMSSLIPGADTVEYASPSAVRRSDPGRAPVRVGVHEQLGARLRSAASETESKSPTMTCGLRPISSSASAPPSTATRTGLKFRMYGPHDPQVALVPGPAGDDDGVAIAELRRQRRKVDAVGEELALVPEVAQRVVGERLERLGDAALLVGERPHERALGELDALGELGSVAPQAAGPHGHRLAVDDLVEQIGARCRVDEADARAHQLERARVREAAGARGRDVDDGPHAGFDELLGRDAVEIDVVDDREIAGPKPLDEILRPPAEPGGADDLGHCSGSDGDRRQELLAAEHALELRAALGGRELLDHRLGRDRRAPSRRGSAASRRSRSAAGG